VEPKQIGIGGSEVEPNVAMQAAFDGSRRGLARALSYIENNQMGPIDPPSNYIPPDKNEWQVLGVTGAPGVGKSCLVDKIIQHWIEQGHKVAILAVDPTSPVTGGALLGDRLRMSNSDGEDSVYFRSIATRKHGGSVPGVVAKMLELLVICGWTKCIVETVGAGQGEIRVAAIADRILLVEAPGRGDGVQAEKAGLIELADLIVVNKSDLDGAQRTADEIRQALQVGATSPPQILLASAATGEGIEEMCISIDQMDEREGGGRAKLLEGVKAVHEQALLDSPQLENILELVASGTSAEMALQALDKQSQQNTQKE
jgi:LAO/AO transport system kinase